MLGAVCDALHHPSQVTAEIAHGLAAFRVHLNFTGAHAVNHVPVEGADERLIVVGDVFIQSVEGGGGSAAPRYSDGGARLVRQFAAGGVVQAIEQGTQRTVRSGEVGGAADDDGIYLIQFFVYGIVKLVVYAAATGLQATAATDATLYGLRADLNNFGLCATGSKTVCYHTEGVESVTFCVRAAVDKKSFHTA